MRNDARQIPSIALQSAIGLHLAQTGRPESVHSAPIVEMTSTYRVQPSVTATFAQQHAMTHTKDGQKPFILARCAAVNSSGVQAEPSRKIRRTVQYLAVICAQNGNRRRSLLETWFSSTQKTYQVWKKQVPKFLFRLSFRSRSRF